MSIDTKAMKWVGAWEPRLNGPVSLSRSVLVLLGLIVLVALWYLCAGSAFITNDQMDYLFELDASWRLASHQLPYRDFITPVGPVFYGALYVARVLFGAGPESPVLAIFPFAVLGGLGLLFMGRTRLPPRVALLLAGLLTLRAISPRFIDSVFTDASFLALYNTLSMLFLALVLLGSVFAPRQPRPIQDGLWIGCAMLALVGLKLNMAVYGGAAMCVGICVHARLRSTLLVAGVVVAAGLVVAWVAAPELVRAYLLDVHQATQANGWMDRLHDKSMQIVMLKLPYLLISVFELWIIEKLRDTDPKHRVHHLLSALVLFLVGWGVVLNDHENTPILLILMFLYVAMALMDDTVVLRGQPGVWWRRTKYAVVFAPVLVVGAWPMLNDVGSTLIYTPRALLATPVAWTGTAPGLNHLRFSFGGAEGGEDEVQRVQEALDLVREHHQEHATILDAEFVNMVPYLLQSPPPKHTLAWMDGGRTFNATAHPDPERMLSDTQVVLRPMHRDHADRGHSEDLFWTLYGPTIQKDYQQVASTDHWDMFVRR